MTLIKRIINWFINLLKRIFSKIKISKKIRSLFNKQSNKHYFKEYGFNDDSFHNAFPIYLMISDLKKEELIKKVNLIKRTINNKKDNDKILENTINKIKYNKISFYQNELINEKLDEFLDDKKIEIDISNKIIKLDKEVVEIIENYDKGIKEKTKKEYNIVNYITLTTLLLDETIIEIKKIEEDFHHHKYNKYYYNRELKKIKIRIENLCNLRENESVREEIELLKTDLYTKKKDKYDLLYNNEVFLSIEKQCDNLIKKVNRRIIDLKKESEEQKRIKLEKETNGKKQKEEKEKLKNEKDYYENILKRFQDIDLARKLLMLINRQNEENFNIDSYMSNINSAYLEFVSGEKFKFNYNRNKEKFELVKLINNIGRVNALIRKKDFIPLEHINYLMLDLIEYSELEKNDLDEIRKEMYNYEKEKDELSILVDNKLGILKEKEIKKHDKQKNYIKAQKEK